MGIQEYVASLRNLRPYRIGGRPRPHKACMLLAVMDLVDREEIRENQIKFDSKLKEAFSQRFERYRQDDDQDDPSKPYFYLTSSSFWEVVPNEGFELELNKRLESRDWGGAGIVSKLIKYACLDDGLFELMRDPVSRDILTAEVESTLIGIEEYFRRWCKSIGKSEKTISAYIKELNSLPSGLVGGIGIETPSIFSMHQPPELEMLRESIGMYSVVPVDPETIQEEALRHYAWFLEERTNSRLASDIRELNTKDLDPTVREYLVSARVGQGIFRAGVLAQYDFRCAVTGYKNERLLIASHIKPWKDANDRERLDRFNGLALTPNLDRVFDLGYISFDSCGKIIISSKLEVPEKLGVYEDQSVKIENRHGVYLEQHRSQVFEKWLNNTRA